MKPDNVVDALARFFNDLIGSVVPGGLLLTGLLLAHTDQVSQAITTRIPTLEWGAALFLAISYVLGHFLLATAAWIQSGGRKFASRIPVCAGQRKGGVLAPDESSAVKTFRQLVGNKYQRGAHSSRARGADVASPPLAFNELRNIAMTVAPVGATLGYRFMSISLLCMGCGTALCMIALETVVVHFISPQALVLSDRPSVVIQALLLCMVALPLFLRTAEFRKRALETPFPVAIAELYFPKPKSKDEAKS